MRIGVLASQGAFAEHIAKLRQLGAEAVPVRLPEELEGLDGLVIPGGESTSISRLMRDFHLADKIKERAQSGLPVFGTCAGMILLAKKNSDAYPETLGLMDISVRRNAFGRQRESFEAELSVPVLGEKPFPGVFIRAPLIEKADGKVEILARLGDGTMVAAREGRLLALAFHPELTDDLRFHQYFLDIACGKR
ncbi:MAG TPA: pyridoxal 5'-phosphate synthase glutaminase subunit PdxT [Dehalococcoidia bacterium]|jgi:5'-phosphate synthase pdxT subunit|nr:pyridoxal 5'-phosphate synthase glutaminase subunit PdxT [Dehalococcoidia bacterium]